MTMDDSDLKRTMPGWLKLLVTVMCLAVVVGVLWQLLPQGSFPSDLSRIGQGQPALVMLREVHVVGGDQVMNMMLQVHPEYEERMQFLVTHTGHPDGVAFSETHGVRDGELVLFDANGNVVDIMGRPGSPQELRAFAERALP
jgi:hypothetical protein